MNSFAMRIWLEYNAVSVTVVFVPFVVLWRMFVVNCMASELIIVLIFPLLLVLPFISEEEMLLLRVP